MTSYLLGQFESDVLTATDMTAKIEVVLLDLSRQHVQRIDHIWKRRKQAKYLEAVASIPTADPVLLRYFQRKFKPFTPRPMIVMPKVFYWVRLGRVPGVYTTWTEAQ